MPSKNDLEQADVALEYLFYKLFEKLDYSMWIYNPHTGNVLYRRRITVYRDNTLIDIYIAIYSTEVITKYYYKQPGWREHQELETKRFDLADVEVISKLASHISCTLQ